jgi:hypothetical protein
MRLTPEARKEFRKVVERIPDDWSVIRNNALDLLDTIDALEQESSASVEAALREAAAHRPQWDMDGGWGPCTCGVNVWSDESWRDHIISLISPGNALQRYGDRERLAEAEWWFKDAQMRRTATDPINLSEREKNRIAQLRSRAGAPERKT